MRLSQEDFFKMATYRMEDGTVVKTENATQSWEKARGWDGRNHIGRSSQSQWHYQTLHRSKKGRYWIEYESRVQGERERAEWVSQQEAVRFLIFNGFEIPAELQEHAEEVCE